MRCTGPGPVKGVSRYVAGWLVTIVAYRLATNLTRRQLIVTPHSTPTGGPLNALSFAFYV
eukprot:2784295-Prymnesium_polylepis.2